MGNGEREDENRRLAEWLEPDPKWTVADQECGSNLYGVQWATSDGGAWRRCYIGTEIDYEGPPDFRTDEAANAMIRRRVLDLPFSQRRRFKRELQSAVSARFEMKELIALEELVLVAEREDWCIAALALLNERGRG